MKVNYGTNATESAITIKDYEKRFRRFRVKNTNINIGKNKIHAIIGPSGSGKSVILKSIIGSITSYKGEIVILGKKSTNPKSKFNIGFSMNLEAFPIGMKAMDFVQSLARITGLKGRSLKNRLEELFNLYGLWEHRNKTLNSYSSGMKNRIMLIQATIHDPEIIILDEPGVNLDTEGRKFLNQYLRDEKAAGKTILLTTHLINEVKDMIDECTIIQKGEVIFTGPIEEQEIDKVYTLKSTNNKLFLTYLIENKIRHRYNVATNEIQLQVHNHLAINNMFAFALKNNIIILTLNPTEIDLSFMKSGFFDIKVI
ncbi:ABC transporter ATP-binding protein [Spiroplasma endosymbiont of Anurida maritima]|uniref:ABC transporter ATP-binding protein n=1 Tax=Spiroplasma endosymbiont of Anurida maritima TaxID=2967972 RepID=UPI0036D2CCFB